MNYNLYMAVHYNAFSPSNPGTLFDNAVQLYFDSHVYTARLTVMAPAVTELAQ